MSISIVEGSLTFTFNTGWEAQKYDDWSFYRKQFISVCKVCDAKAVDIVAYNEDTAWLIEIKDYRRNQRIKSIDLADEVAKKVYDTLSGLAAAQYRAYDVTEKDMANKLLRKRQWRVVLHLEQPVYPSKLFPKIVDPADVVSKLKKQIKAIDPHPEVLDISTTNSIATYWRVR